MCVRRGLRRDGGGDGVRAPGGALVRQLAARLGGPDLGAADGAVGRGRVGWPAHVARTTADTPAELPRSPAGAGRGRPGRHRLRAAAAAGCRRWHPAVGPGRRGSGGADGAGAGGHTDVPAGRPAARAAGGVPGRARGRRLAGGPAVGGGHAGQPGGHAGGGVRAAARAGHARHRAGAGRAVRVGGAGRPGPAAVTGRRRRAAAGRGQRRRGQGRWQRPDTCRAAPARGPPDPLPDRVRARGRRRHPQPAAERDEGSPLHLRSARTQQRRRLAVFPAGPGRPPRLRPAARARAGAGPGRRDAGARSAVRRSPAHASWAWRSIPR